MPLTIVTASQFAIWVESRGLPTGSAAHTPLNDGICPTGASPTSPGYHHE